METAVATLIIASSFFLQSVFGFAGGVISIPLLSLFLGVKTSVTLALIFQLLFSVLAYHTRKEAEWSAIGLAFPWLLLGVCIGIYALAVLHEFTLRLILSSAIAAYLIYNLLVPRSEKKLLNAKQLAVVGGVLGGFFQGMLGSGGPVLVIYVSELRLSKSATRATLFCLFFVMNIVRLFTSYAGGLFSSEITRMALWATPFFFASIYAGQLYQQRIAEQLYRKAVYVLLFISLLSLLFKSFVEY